MTALAGVVGDLPKIALTRACHQALDAQRLYGNCPVHIESAAGASLGACNHRSSNAASTPISRSHDGRLLLVADIRLDNSEELLRALGPASQAANSSASDILVQAWSRWGVESLDRIVGDFAVAIYDIRQRALILARDPSGQRPLYYALRDDALTFGSMPSGVLAGTPPRGDLAYLANILAAAGNHGSATPFDSLHRVLPGEVVRISLPIVERRSYWRPCTEDLWPNERAALIETYRSQLDEAVSCRIKGQGSVAATHLSAGYDSSAVAATAARVKEESQRLTAFTSAPLAGLCGAVPRGRIGDESLVAAEVAAMHGMEHRIVRSGDSLLAALRDHTRFYQAPVGNVFNLPWVNQIRNEAASIGARVLLTGAMGNYTLNAGGLPVLRDLVRHGHWLRWWREARDAVNERSDVRWRGALVASFRPWLPDSFLDASERLFNEAPPASTYCFLRKEWRQSERAAMLASAPPVPRGDYAAERLAIIGSSDPGAFRKGGLAQSGVQECDPTADRRLIEFSLKLPSEQMIHEGIYRPLARAALADRLPSSVIDAPVRGYQGADWFARLRRDDALTMLEEISTSEGVRELIDVGKLRRAIEQWPNANDVSFARLAVFGRTVTDALAVGMFLSEVERYPEALGV